MCKWYLLHIIACLIHFLILGTPDDPNSGGKLAILESNDIVLLFMMLMRININFLFFILQDVSDFCGPGVHSERSYEL